MSLLEPSLQLAVRTVTELCEREGWEAKTVELSASGEDVMRLQVTIRSPKAVREAEEAYQARRGRANDEKGASI